MLLHVHLFEDCLGLNDKRLPFCKQVQSALVVGQGKQSCIVDIGCGRIQVTIKILRHELLEFVIGVGVGRDCQLVGDSVDQPLGLDDDHIRYERSH